MLMCYSSLCVFVPRTTTRCTCRPTGEVIDGSPVMTGCAFCDRHIMDTMAQSQMRANFAAMNRQV